MLKLSLTSGGASFDATGEWAGKSADRVTIGCEAVNFSENQVDGCTFGMVGQINCDPTPEKLGTVAHLTQDMGGQSKSLVEIVAFRRVEYTEVRLESHTTLLLESLSESAIVLLSDVSTHDPAG